MIQWAIFWRYGDHPNEEWMYQSIVFAGDHVEACKQYAVDKNAKHTGEIMAVQISLPYYVVKLPLKT
jgi:hypothetical protein